MAHLSHEELDGIIEKAEVALVGLKALKGTAAAPVISILAILLPLSQKVLDVYETKRERDQASHQQALDAPTQ